MDSIINAIAGIIRKKKYWLWKFLFFFIFLILHMSDLCLKKGCVPETSQHEVIKNTVYCYFWEIFCLAASPYKSFYDVCAASTVAFTLCPLSHKPESVLLLPHVTLSSGSSNVFSSFSCSRINKFVFLWYLPFSVGSSMLIRCIRCSNTVCSSITSTDCGWVVSWGKPQFSL